MFWSNGNVTVILIYIKKQYRVSGFGAERHIDALTQIYKIVRKGESYAKM